MTLPPHWRDMCVVIAAAHGLDAEALERALAAAWSRVEGLTDEMPNALARRAEALILRHAIREALGPRPAPEAQRIQPVLEQPGRICACCRKRCQAWLSDSQKKSHRVCCNACFRASEDAHPPGEQAGMAAPRESLFQIGAHA